MASEQNKRAAELFTSKYEATHPRQAGESAFAYYLRGIQWLATPEGKQAFADSAREAKA